VSNIIKKYYNKVFNHFVGKNIDNKYSRFVAHSFAIIIHVYLIWVIATTIGFFVSANEEWSSLVVIWIGLPLVWFLAPLVIKVDPVSKMFGD